MSQIRALGLLSGGLDSTLAARLMLDQGIEVRGVNFNTGFCITDTRRQVRGKRSHQIRSMRHEALRAGSDLNVPVDVVDVSREYLETVTNPRWGYGKNANPCIDCRIMMMSKTREMMSELGAQFVFTGEVVGQRPMTQHRPTLRQIEKQAGLPGLVLRPLSAKKLPETEPERRGWVDRSKLKGFSGRSRKPQIALAEEYGLTDFPQPAGGCCFLTDPAFGRKFFDFIQNRPPNRPIQLEDFVLLKVGRHLRLSNGQKLVVGRDEAENDFLENYRRGRWAIIAANVVGPLALLDGEIAEDNLEDAARVVARYSDGRDRHQVEVLCEKNGHRVQLAVEPASNEETAEYIIT